MNLKKCIEKLRERENSTVGYKYDPPWLRLCAKKYVKRIKVLGHKKVQE